MKNIITIMKYESLMLARTWKFWILAIVGMFFPVTFNIALIMMRKFGEGAPGWLSLEGAPPFFLFYMYNIIQTAIVIFLTSDFREKDHKAQVHEVMCSRSMTNLEYICGKYFGIVIPLLLLTMAIICILSVVNFFANGVFAFEDYLFNFALLNLPGLIFITAFIIFTSSLLRNTAVVFIVVSIFTAIGIYFGGVNVFSQNQLWLFLDYLGYYLPIFPSDLVGVVDLQLVIMQRIFYVCLGGVFLGLTVVFFYPRLQQSRFWEVLTIAGSIACFAVSANIFYGAWVAEKERLQLAQSTIEGAYRDYISDELRVSSYEMDYTLYNGNSDISASVTMIMNNAQGRKSGNIPLVLNPGLIISSITDASGSPVNYTRNGLDLIVNSDGLLNSAGPFRITIDFEGTIDEGVLFLTRGEKDKGLFDRDMPPTVDNIPALLDRDYSYLFPQTFWYPQLYNPYSFTYPEKRPDQFFTGNWKYNIPEDFTVISQGIVSSIDSTSASMRKIYSYTSEVPVKALSLNMGKYERYSTDVSGVQLDLYISKNHSIIMDFFTDIKDEALTVIDDAMRGIVEITGLTYPYPTLSYVEVPIVVQWYQDNGLYNQLTAQPSVLMVSEDVLMRSYKERFDRKRRSADRRSIEKSDSEIKKEIFIELIVDQMFGDNWWQNDKIATPVSSFWSHNLDFRGRVYPAYGYYFDKYLEELISNEIEFYITNQEKEERIGGDFSPWEIRRYYGISVDTLYHLIRNVPLAELIPTSENKNYHGIMKYKTSRLNNIFLELITPEKFKEVLIAFREKYRYSTVTVNDFQNVSESVTGRSMDWFFENWLKGSAFPGYYVTGLETYKLKGGKNGVQYLVEVSLKNGETESGYVKVMLETKEDRVFKRSEVRGNQELKFGFLVDDYPEEIEINPIFAQNVGNIRKKIHVSDRFDKKQEWDGIREIRSEPDVVQTMTIDDLDEGFKVLTSDKSNYLRPPRGEAEWKVRDDALAFGKYKNTYRRKKAGSGMVSASWEAEIPASGIYEIEVFIYKGSDWRRRWLERRVASEFSYVITHGEGTRNVELSWKAVPEGWNILGRYYFQEGQTASVVLSDKADGELIADAVRFIPVRTSDDQDMNH